MVGRAYVATLRTTDPQGRTIAVRIAPAGNGIITVDAAGPPDADTMAVRFERQGGERFLGFGERSDAVVRSRGEVQNRVAEGPYQAVRERRRSRAFVPPPGFNDPRTTPRTSRSRGCSPRAATGVLVDGNATSRFDARQPVERERRRRPPAVHASTRATARRRAAPLQRRRRAPAAARRAVLLRPVVAARRRRRPEHRAAARPRARWARSMQTYTHYLPCGDQQGHTAEQQAMTAQAHAAGLAVTTYFNPMICTTYQPPYGLAAAGGFLNTNAAGQPYVYPTRARACSRSASSTSPRRARRGSTATCWARRSATATTAGWRTSASTRRPTRSRPTARPARRCTTAYPRALPRRRLHVRAGPRAAAAGALQPLGLDRRGARVADRVGRRPDDRASASTA